MNPGFPLNALVTIPCAPTAGCGCSTQTPSCSTCVDPSGVAGNGIGSFVPGSSPIPIAATQALQGYRAVKIVNGGLAYASNDNPSDLGIEIAVIGTACASGSQANAYFTGPLTNPVNGVGGWNFTLGQQVYLGTNGQLTQTAPDAADGFTLAIGIPLSSNTLFIYPPQDRVAVRPSGLELVGSTLSARITTSTWGTARISQNATLSMVGAAEEGQPFSAAITNTSGSSIEITLGSSFDIPSSSSLSSPVSIPANSETVFGFRYNKITERWRVVAAVSGYSESIPA